MNAPVNFSQLSGQPLGSRWQPGEGSSGTVSMTLSEDCPLGRAGETIQMAVTPAETSVQTEELETYLGGYRPFGFVADEFSKVVLVDKEAGQRRDFSEDNAFEEVDVRQGRNGAINEIDHKSGLTSYRVEEFALATWIPWMSENDAAALYNLRASAGEMIGWKLALAREVRVFESLTNTSNWNANNQTTLASSFKWNTGGSKDPRKDIHDRIKASAQPVNLIGMNPDVAFYFLSDDKVVAYMKQMLGDAAPSADVAAAAATNEGDFESLRFKLPGLPPFLICPAKKKNPSTGNLDYVVGNDVVLCTVPPGVPRDGNRVATHMTFRHRGRSGTGVVTNEYMPNGRGINGGTMFEMGYADDDFFGSNIAGGLIADVLS